MLGNKKILCVIPARGGSKGLPRKNIRIFSGKPLIAWTIEQALSSKYIDKIIVSTDDDEIARISLKCGADVPFKRPRALSTSRARAINIVIHSINYFKKKGEKYDLLLLLQPTSVLRTSEDIDNACELMGKNKAKGIVSVCQIEHHPWWSNTLPKNMSMRNFLNIKKACKSRQELPIYYRLNGAIYLAEIGYLERNKNFLGRYTYAYIMPHHRSIDIDTIIDFEFAQLLKKKNLKNK